MNFQYETDEIEIMKMHIVSDSFVYNRFSLFIHYSFLTALEIFKVQVSRKFLIVWAVVLRYILDFITVIKFVHKHEINGEVLPSVISVMVLHNPPTIPTQV